MLNNPPEKNINPGDFRYIVIQRLQLKLKINEPYDSIVDLLTGLAYPEYLNCSTPEQSFEQSYERMKTIV